MKKQIQKSIRFPAKAVELIEEETKRTLGINFNEFLKVYVISKAEEIQKRNLLSPELFEEIKTAKNEVKTGKRSVLKTDKDIDSYVSGIMK